MKRFLKRLTKDDQVPEELDPLRMEPADQDVIFTLGCKTQLVDSEIVSTKGDGTFLVVEAYADRNLYRVKRIEADASKHLEHYFIAVT